MTSTPERTVLLVPGSEHRLSWHMEGNPIGAVTITAGEDGVDIIGSGPLTGISAAVNLDSVRGRAEEPVQRWSRLDLAGRGVLVLGDDGRREPLALAVGDERCVIDALRGDHVRPGALHGQALGGVCRGGRLRRLVVDDRDVQRLGRRRVERLGADADGGCAAQQAGVLGVLDLRHEYGIPLAPDVGDDVRRPAVVQRVCQWGRCVVGPADHRQLVGVDRCLPGRLGARRVLTHDGQCVVRLQCGQVRLGRARVVPCVEDDQCHRVAVDPPVGVECLRPALQGVGRHQDVAGRALGGVRLRLDEANHERRPLRRRPRRRTAGDEPHRAQGGRRHAEPEDPPRAPPISAHLHDAPPSCSSRKGHFPLIRLQ
jgi:hypothetical protein